MGRRVQASQSPNSCPAPYSPYHAMLGHQECGCLSQVFVGMDVATAQLDMALRPMGERWAVTNDDAGIAALVTRFRDIAPQLLVLEATGSYQRAVVAALATAPPGGGGQSPPRT